MKVYFIGAGPGAADLITVRGLKLVQTCPICIYAGSLVPQDIIKAAPDDARIINSADLDLEQIIDAYKQAQADNLDVARLHSGDPSLYGAMAEQMRALDQLGIDYEVVPGVPAFAAAAAALKSELTVPGVNQSLVLTRTSRNSSPMPSLETLENLAASQATLVLHLSAANGAEVQAKLVPIYGADCPVVLAVRISWPDEKIVRGRLGDLADLLEREDIKRTALIFVGRALEAQDFENSALYRAHAGRDAGL